MAKYRKLGRTSSQRKALIRNQVTALLNNGKIVTTEAKAKEIQSSREGLIALAVKEKIISMKLQYNKGCPPKIKTARE